MIYFDRAPVENKPLIYNFFVAFSVFEYSLKMLGFARQIRNYLKIEWERFTDEEVTPHFENIEMLPDQVKNAIQYLFEYPPNEQNIEDEKIRWSKISQESDETNARWVYRILKTTRNNLFHGGKYPYDPIRDTDLLQSCLIILMYWAELKPEIQDVFDQVKQSYFVGENETF